MTNEEYKIALKKVFGFCDKIDLLYWIKEYKELPIYKIMDKLDELYPYCDEYSQELFDCVAEDEFEEYVLKRYSNVKSYDAHFEPEWHFRISE